MRGVCSPGPCGLNDSNQSTNHPSHKGSDYCLFAPGNEL